jgi:hypothetical protein
LIIKNGGPHFTFDRTKTGVTALAQAIDEDNTVLVDALCIAMFSNPPSIINSEELRKCVSKAFHSAYSNRNLAVARLLLRHITYSVAIGVNEILESLLLENGGFFPTSEPEVRSAFQSIARFPNI